MDTEARVDVDREDPGMSQELEKAAANKGLVAVYPDPAAADAVRRALEQDERAAHDLEVISEPSGLDAKMLTPTEPESRRDSRIAYGAIGGLVAGGLLGVAFYAGYPASTLTALFSVIVGMLIGVLYGATLAGLCMPPYRDDTVHILKRHIERGHALLVAVGDEAQLRETRSLIGKTKPIEVFTS